MIKAFSGDIGIMGFLGSVELSKIYILAVYPYAGSPFICIFPISCPHYPGFAVSPSSYLVLHIDLSISITKVSNSVIGFNAIDMVDFIRPDAKHVKPCKAVEPVIFIINAKEKITARIYSAYNITYAPFINSSECYKNTSIRIVMEKLFKPFLSKHLTPLINRLIESAARLIRPFSGCIPSRTNIVTNLGVI
jgi:hypothetical protein